MKKIKSIILLLMAFSVTALAQTGFYGFRVKTIDGNDFDFSTLKGKKVMIVNTASKCGFTPQYKELEALFEKYRDQLVIIGFPANNFASQEPGSNEEIRKFCTDNYGVTFPMMSKVSVKGNDMSPVYKWLTSKELNGMKDSEVSWNFQKYLIDENGKLVDVLDPKVKPDSEKVLAWISE
ncbi:MAG: glutathione peroxidase [Chloroflexota bacterium]